MIFEKLITTNSLKHQKSIFSQLKLSNSVDIFLYDCNLINNKHLPHLAIQLLHNEELEIYNRRKNLIAKKEYVSSRYIIKYLIAQHFSLNYEQLKVKFDQTKKSLIIIYNDKNLPVSISLSHSAGIIVFALSISSISFGIDIEQIKSRDYQALAKHFYPQDEITLITKYGKKAFYRLWTLKEALSKMLKQPIVKIVHNSTEQLLSKVNNYSMTYCDFDVSFVTDNALNHLKLIEIQLKLNTSTSK